MRVEVALLLVTYHAALGLLQHTVLSSEIHFIQSRHFVLYDITVAKNCRITLREGGEPCSDIKTYLAQKSCSGLDFSSVHSVLLQKLLSTPSNLSKLLITKSFFKDCSEPISLTCDAPSFKNVQKFQRSKFLEELIEVLEDSDIDDERALHIFEDKRDAIKLTPEESLIVYSKAFALRPNTSLITNKFGQTLQNFGRNDLTVLLYKTAVENGLWPNSMQRPEWNYIASLTSKPWHCSADFQFTSVLEAHYMVIQKELNRFLLNQSRHFATERWNLNGFQGGHWTALALKTSPGVQGYTSNSAYFPETIHILSNTNEDFIEVKFSALEPGTHILPHTGPSNNRLRAHLCLIHTGGAKLRVGNEWRTWEEGKVFIFDSSWEHEVIHEGPERRVVMILDVWHPECSDDMKDITY